MKRFSLAVITAVLVLLVPTVAHAQALADIVLSTRQPPVCVPNSTRPYLAYNPSDGTWHCGNVQLLEFAKTITGIGENINTSILTVTVPNAGIASLVHLRIFAALGAGGSVAPNECVGVVEANVTISRTAAKQAVAAVSSSGLTASSCVASAQGIQINLTTGSDIGTVTGGTTGVDAIRLYVRVANVNSFARNHVATVVYSVRNLTTTNGSSVQ